MYISINYVWVHMSALISHHQTMTADERESKAYLHTCVLLTYYTWPGNKSI